MSETPNPPGFWDDIDAAARIIGPQNDRFRRTLGHDPGLPGQVVLTAALSEALSDIETASLLHHLGAFDGFTPEDDPYGYRDFGVMRLGARTIWFKIDLFDLDYRYGAPEPTDPAQTRRVLTLMFPEDW